MSNAHTAEANGATALAVPTYTVARELDTATAMRFCTAGAGKGVARHAAPGPATRMRNGAVATHAVVVFSMSKSCQSAAVWVYSGAGRAKAARGLPAYEKSAEGPMLAPPAVEPMNHIAPPKKRREVTYAVSPIRLTGDTCAAPSW